MRTIAESSEATLPSLKYGPVRSMLLSDGTLKTKRSSGRCVTRIRPTALLSGHGVALAREGRQEGVAIRGVRREARHHGARARHRHLGRVQDRPLGLGFD